MSLSPLRSAIIIFCLWHMAAVGVYAIPTDATGAIPGWLRANVQPHVYPYILMTSQWQQWNLFSPDPLRRVMVYAVEADRGGTWEPVVTLGPGAFSTWRHAAELKYLGRLLEGGENQLPLVERFLHVQCREYRLRPGTHLRLVYHWYVIPWLENPLSVSAWQNVVPNWSSSIGSEILCGWPVGTGVLRPLSS